MKIGILTYHRAYNYGAVLQAYALQTYLKGQGHEASMIDYWPKYHREVFSQSLRIPKEISLKGKLKVLLLYVIGYNRKVKHGQLFSRFIGENFGLKDVPQMSFLPDGIDKYEVIIYGSDQIWRKQSSSNFLGFDNVYFGSNVSARTKRVAYAASMGTISVEQSDEVFIKESLATFSAISVREKMLQAALKTICGITYPIVLDPVFLLKRTKWETLLPPRKVKEPYLLYYPLKKSKKATIQAEFIAKKKQLRLIQVNPVVDPLKFGKRYMETFSTPFEFLSLLLYADFVISTSFHGTAFSLIFERPFLTMDLETNAGRVLSLLSMVDLESRYLEEPNTNFDTEQRIDFTKCRSIIDKHRIDSELFLSQAIQ